MAMTRADSTQISHTTQAPGSVETNVEAELWDLRTDLGALEAQVAAPTGVTSINGGQLAGLRNVIYNGQMEIYQRGSTQSLTSTYAWGSLDRWAFKQAGTSGQSTAGRNSGWLEPHRLRNHAYMSRNVGSTSLGTLSMGQALELPETLHFTGKQITLSFWARCGSAFSAANGYLYAKITQGHSGFESIVNIGSWSTQTVLFDTPVVVVSTAPTRYQITATVENDLNQLGIEFYWTGTGTAQTFDYVQITGVQLELGAVATPFEQRPYGMELALCQRYFLKLGNDTAGARFNLGSGGLTSTTSGSIYVAFPTTMRTAPAAPTIIGATQFRMLGSNQGAACTVSAADQNTTSANLTITGTGLTANGGIIVQSVDAPSPVPSLSFSAEL